MADLDIANKAPIADADGNQLGAVGQEQYHITSSDPAIASVDWIDWRPWVTAHATGTVTLSGTRLVDSATATLDVTVTETALGAFVMTLGEAVPK